jgi:hypothetical protein
MKNAIILFTFLSSILLMHSIQASVIVEIDSTSPKIFYVGQEVYFRYHVSNPLDQALNVEKTSGAYIKYIRNTETGETFERISYRAGGKVIPKDTISQLNPNEQAQSPIQAKFSETFTNARVLSMIGDQKLSDFISFPKGYSGTSLDTRFFSAGTYEVTLAYKMWPTGEEIIFTHAFQVIEPSDDILAQRNVYFQARLRILANYRDYNANILGGDINSLLSFIKQYPESPYVGDALKLLTLDYLTKSKAHVTFMANDALLAEVFHQIPRMHTEYARYYSYLFLYTCICRELNYLGNNNQSMIRALADDYLQLLAGYAPELSDIIIQKVEENFESIELTNYSKR